MSKKVTSTDLEKLIKEALLNEIDAETLSQAYNKDFFRGKMPSSVFDELPAKASDFIGLAATVDKDNVLDSDDLQYYEDNIDKITTKVESQLIALKYMPNKEFYDKKIAEVEGLSSATGEISQIFKDANEYISKNSKKIELEKKLEDKAIEQKSRDNFVSDQDMAEARSEINDATVDLNAAKNAQVAKFEVYPFLNGQVQLNHHEKLLGRPSQTGSPKKPIVQSVEYKDEHINIYPKRTRISKVNPVEYDDISTLQAYQEQLQAAESKLKLFNRYPAHFLIMQNEIVVNGFEVHKKKIDDLVTANRDKINQISEAKAALAQAEAKKKRLKAIQDSQKVELKTIQDQINSLPTTRKGFATSKYGEFISAAKDADTDAKKQSRKKHIQFYTMVKDITSIKQYKAFSEYLENKGNVDELDKLRTKASSILKTLRTKIDDAAKSDQTALGKRFTTAKGDFGEFDLADSSLIKRFFGKTDAVSVRIKKVSDISLKFLEMAEKGEAYSGSNSDFLSEIQLLDLITSVVKDYDSGAGAYVFEYFLALLAGGNVEGKATTDAGKMGAADLVYTLKDGKRYGSAKFVQRGSSSQAVSGFQSLFKKKFKKDPTDPTFVPSQSEILEVEYVITVKKSDFVGTAKDPLTAGGALQESVNTVGVSSDPSRIIALMVWTPTITFDGNVFKVKENDQELEIEKASVGKAGGLKLDISKFGASIGTIYMARHRTETFKRMLTSTLETQNEDLRKAFEGLQKYMESLQEAETNVRLYTTTRAENEESKKDRITYADEAFRDLTEAEGHFKQVVENIGYNHSIHDTGDMFRAPLSVKDNSVTEGQKITADFLKKLISESFKK
jgi:hypothetical protein